MTGSRSSALALLSRISVLAAFMAALLLAGTASAQGSAPADLAFNRGDLDFILKQIVIAERHAAGEELFDIIPNASLPWGLRTVDGSYNNIIPGREQFGQADELFPNDTPRVFPAADNGTSYDSHESVMDASPRLISHLIVNQSTDNPAAVFAAAEEEGENIGPDIAGVDQLFIPNTAPDEGLSAPINAFMTFFGQFFDHGLDLVNKGGNGVVMMAVPPDDPLFDPAPGAANVMVMPRATQLPGADGIQGTADDVHSFVNATTPHVDQQQTYASHASSQVLLRDYETVNGRLQNTGRLMNGTVGGMATWDDVQAMGLAQFGIDLDDQDGNNVPMIAADPYGQFIPGPLRGLPQLVTAIAADGTPTLVEGNLAAPVDASQALRVNQSFFLDVAHSAAPNGLPDADNVINARVDVLNAGTSNEQVTRGVRASAPEGFYDDELLGVHFVCGDGRCNENIALTTIHTIFHAEHNRLVDVTRRVVLDSRDLAFLNEWLDTPVTVLPAELGLGFPVSNASLSNQAATRAAIDALGLDWNGERVFQVARFGTEMQYNRVVFDEFAPTLAGLKDDFEGFHTDVDPTITAEFSQSVYRFGHSMLTQTVDRYDPDFQPITEAVSGDNSQLGLFEAFLNPLALYNSDEAGNPMLSPEAGTGAVIRGITRTTANEIDEFVTGAMQNNVVGLPLDLGAINIARGRDVGNPPLNVARAAFFAATADTRLAPYAHWMDYLDNVRHEPTIVNFIAAYGQHATVTDAVGYAGKRAAACAIISAVAFSGTAYCTDHGFGDVSATGAPADAMDFLFSTGTWAAQETGINNVDFWNGGLAEERQPFGGYLGSTHNFVFENQIERLQNGDRFYYVGRTNGMHLFEQLESNSFTALIMRNTDIGEAGGGALPINVFVTQNHILEVDQTQQFSAAQAADRAAADAAASAAAADLAAAEAALAAALAAGSVDVAAAQTAADAADAALAAAQAASDAANATLTQAGIDSAASEAALALAQAGADAAQVAADQANADLAAAQAAAGTQTVTVIGTDTVGGNGRFRLENGDPGTSPESGNGTIEARDANGNVVAAIACNPRGGGDWRCRGRDLTAGQAITIVDVVGVAGEVDPAIQAAADAANAALATALADLATAQAAADAASAALVAAQADADAAAATLATAQANATTAAAALAAAIEAAASGPATAEELVALQAAVDAASAASAAAQAAAAATPSAQDDPAPEAELVALVIRDASRSTAGVNATDPGLFLQYTGGDHVTLMGTEGPDTLIGGIGDDSIWGRGGNDRIEGGDGADLIEAGAGDDIITDLAGPDVIEGGEGNDAISSGNEEDVIFGDAGSDFIVNSSEFGEVFGGEGNDFGLDGISISHYIMGPGDDWLEELGGGENIHLMDNGKIPESGEPAVKGNDVYIAYGGNNDMDMENGDDIMVDGPGIERMEGQLGFDWASFQNDVLGTNVDMNLTIFVRPILPPSNDSISNRYDRVEGLSGSPFGDILKGTSNLPGSTEGNELVNFGLITGLDDLVPAEERRMLPNDPVTGAPQFGWTGGEIILAGGGSDLVTGNGGDDIIDGDSALRVGLAANGAVVNGMEDLMADVFSGALNPGDIAISRVISDEDPADASVDAVTYSGDMADYDVVVGPEFIRITDVRPLPIVQAGRQGQDGSDLVKNVERVVFADQTTVLPAGTASAGATANAVAVGAPTISGIPEVGEVLTASLAGVSDGDNAVGTVTGPVDWIWESELEIGSDFFAPVERIGGILGNGDPFQIHGASLEVTAQEIGLRIRVVGIFQDDAGVFEVVRSAAVQVPLPPGAVLDPDIAADIPASFVGDVADIDGGAAFFNNRSQPGFPRWDVEIPNVSLALFANTRFADPIAATDEIEIDRVELVFANAGGETGRFIPQIVAIEDPVTLVVSQVAVDIQWSIRGIDVAGLVDGPTTASILVDGVEIALRNLNGDSSLNSGQAAPNGNVTGFDPEPDTPAVVVVPAAAVEPTLAATGVANARGRLRITGTCVAGTASADGLRCRTRQSGNFRCTGSRLTPGQEVPVTCN